ncbi:MAG: RNA methyltransferase, partial [Candidatus Nanoarchaeia archaeon]
MEIISAQNPKIKYASRLRNRHFRDEQKKTLLEGYRAVRRACEVGFPMEICFYCPELFLGSNEQDLLARLEKAGVSLCRVSQNAFAKLAYRDRPEGL